PQSHKEKTTTADGRRFTQMNSIAAKGTKTNREWTRIDANENLTHSVAAQRDLRTVSGKVGL
ncbi:MAG: hypothetical protein WAM44_04030, partial [Chthoniobacterales bacterium]